MSEGHALHDTLIAALYQQYSPMLLQYLQRRIVIREDAEDLLLEVFIAALECRGMSFFSPEKQRAWLLRVAHNKLIDYYRQQKQYASTTFLENISEEELSSQEYETPEQFVLQEEEYKHVQAQTKKLPPLQQEILRLRFSLGLRHTEIAQRLEKNEGAIRTLLSRSLKFLRNISSLF